MSKHICPKCKILSFNSARSLSLHINKCSILQKRVYRPNIFQNSSILAGDNIPANNKRLYSNISDANQSKDFENGFSPGAKQEQEEEFSPMDVFHNNITDIQQQETVDEDNNNFVSKYYSWQMKLGDIIFSGTRTSDCKRPLRWRQIRFFNIRILLPAVTSDHRTRCNRCGISQLVIDQTVVADVQIIGKKSQSAFSSLAPASTLI